MTAPTLPFPTRTALRPLATKTDFLRCMERIDAWFHQAVLDRPPVRFYKHNAQFEAGEPLDPARWPTLEERWLDTDYQLDAFERSIAGKVFYAETFPVFVPNLGPNLYSAFYGGRLEFAEITSWFERVVSDPADLSALQNDPFQSPYFRKIEDMTRAALTRSADRYWVGYTDLHPALDCVAAWRGVDDLFIDMLESPEKLAPLFDLSVRDFHRIFNHFNAMLGSAGQPSVTWMNIPCHEKNHVPSCDTAAMISPAQFAEFSLPLLRRELAGMGRAIYHVDGRGVAKHLDAILAQPEIQAIQWVQGIGNDWPILQWIPLLKRVRAAGKSVVIDVPLEELDRLIAALPREGLFLCVGVDEGQELDVLRRIERW